jgi:predicted nucleic acid-binding protein
MRRGTSSVADGPVVVDASALVELLVDTGHAAAVARSLADRSLHAPAHLDAEVLSALGRLQRAGLISATKAGTALDRLRAAPITRHPLPELLAGAWGRRSRVALADALYVELADQLGVVVLTTDLRLARATKVARAIS